MNKTESQLDVLDVLNELAEEFVARFRNGERPALSEFAARCPERADEILDLFPTLVAMEHAANPATGEHDDRAVHEAKPLGIQQLGDFRIVREVGRGGMGVVYEAEQVSLGRPVALKILPRHLLTDARHAKRFDREARAAARLHHTNIVPVFGVGTQEGIHYYVMQFINGQGLDEVLVELKRLRDESAAARTANHRLEVTPVATVPAAAREKVAATQAAQSLWCGQFEKTLLFPSPSGLEDDSHADDGFSRGHDRRATAPSRNSGKPSADTTLTQRADATATSGTFTLPGQAESQGKAHSQHVYWQSVARIGVQSAEALQYAHDQGTIHRDIKPGNLLLDAHGSVWITDFGLAKAADQQDLTHSGDVLGTLRYMAPEQFDGKADARSDVYALGLTLYELLALQPAFDEQDRRKLIKQVTTATPARLRTIEPQLPRDLVTIIHKAIERDPQQRYQTAGELAADLQRYLGNEPIRARRISPVTRFVRWCQRNPGGATALLLLLLLLGISAASAILLFNEQDKTASALEDSTHKSQELLQRNQDLDRARLQAEENHRRAREAVDRLLTRVAEDLADQPHMEQIRRALLEDALQFYQVFLKQKGNDPTIRYETGLAYFRVADIERQLGRADESLAHYDEATAIFTDLLEDFPGNYEYREQRAKCELRRGTALGQLYRYDDAVAAYEDAITAWEALAAERPNHPVCLEELARANYLLGGLWQKRYYGDKSRVYLQTAEQVLAQLERDFPNYPVDPTVKLRIPDFLRRSALERGEIQEAIQRGTSTTIPYLPHDPVELARLEQEARETVLQWEQLVAAHPDVPDYRKLFHAHASNLAQILLAMDRLDECELLALRLLDEARQLVEQYPHIPDYRLGLAWNEYNIANLLFLTGRTTESLPYYRAAMEMAGQLAEEYPNEPRIQLHFAGMLNYCPAPQFQDPERTITVIRRSLQFLEGTNSWVDLGRAQTLAGRYDDALQSFAKAREIDPAQAEGARLYVSEALLYYRLGRLEDARNSYRQAIEWMENTPNRVWYMLEARFVCAELEELLGIDEAEEAALEPADVVDEPQSPPADAVPVDVPSESPPE